MDAPDADLLRSFFTGDRAALEELARRYEGPLLGLATGLIHKHWDLGVGLVHFSLEFESQLLHLVTSSLGFFDRAANIHVKPATIRIDASAPM